jgi:hypothetical protein
MVRKLKRLICCCLVLGSTQGGWAFSLLGNFDAYQVASLGYLVGDSLALRPTTDELGFLVDAPLGGPMNLGEEYRWNIGRINYAFDSNFLDYFGSNGVYAVEQAIAILNALTNVSAYSQDLSEVPLESTRGNFRAGALGLLDVKSSVLHLLVEQLGLADPVRYTWTLRVRALPTGAQCPAYVYLVIKRNFDPLTWEPSSYVNGNLYSYRIVEFCPDPDRGDALEFLVDPTGGIFYKAVASPGVFNGSFYTGLTRDDVGGLRYLIGTTNQNFEDPPQNSTLISGGITNTSARQLLFTSNLAVFVDQALTNGPAVLQGLYPNLAISGTENIFTNVVTTNVVAFYTNFPWSPSTAPASLVISNVLETNVVIWFRHTFGNVVTNSYYTNSRITVLETNIGACGPPAPSGTVCTNISTRTVSRSGVVGDFYIVPTNLCSYTIVATQLVRVIATTNLVLVATNATANTNIAGQEFSRSIVTYFTNSIFVVDPVECGAVSGPRLRQGIEKISFNRRSFDSLLGRFFEPATNRFQLTMVTNNLAIVQTFERVVVQPDILFTADELVTDPTTLPIGFGYIARSMQFNINNVGAGLPGPGLIQPSATFSFNKVGLALLNQAPAFLDEATGVPSFIWGSFDGSTNPPTVYPQGTTIVDLENEVLMHIVTTSLPDGRVGVPYSAQLQGARGQPPYSWQLPPGSALPPGLDLSSEGIIFGTPGVAGDYSFTVRMTDSGARAVDGTLTMKVVP